MIKAAKKLNRDRKSKSKKKQGKRFKKDEDNE